MLKLLARSLALATLAGAACGAVGGGMAGTMSGPVEGYGGVVGPGGMGSCGGQGISGLSGQRIDVVFTAAENERKTLSAISFGRESLTCAFLERNWNVDKLAYQCHGRDFDATLSDSAGNSLRLIGTFTGRAAKGTLTLHEAKGDRTIAYDFHGGISGSPEADAAAAEVAPAPKTH